MSYKIHYKTWWWSSFVDNAPTIKYLSNLSKPWSSVEALEPAAWHGTAAATSDAAALQGDWSCRCADQALRWEGWGRLLVDAGMPLRRWILRDFLRRSVRSKSRLGLTRFLIILHENMVIKVQKRPNFWLGWLKMCIDVSSHWVGMCCQTLRSNTYWLMMDLHCCVRLNEGHEGIVAVSAFKKYVGRDWRSLISPSK